MKKLILPTLFLASASVFAHGPTAQQAANSVQKATEIFVATQTAEVRKQFLSVSATQTGHEQFAVVIALKDGTTQFHYACQENEAVEPVTWECQPAN